MNNDACNTGELLCDSGCYPGNRQAASRNCSNICCYQATKGTTCLSLGGGESFEHQNFVNDECVSRDSGFDFETDEHMSRLEFNNITMFEPHPQNFLKSQGHMPCEYLGGSLVKWRMRKLKKDDVNSGNRETLRNSLHWDEFFGKVHIFSAW